MGTLYLVATPIGNLEDISARALRILRQVDLIAAEDTRRTGKLLAHFDIHTRLTSYYEHNKLQKVEYVLSTLSKGDVALVSDAGTPALNDPGYELVKASLDAGFNVSPIPGPSAPLAALVASGLPTDTFLYLGYLPRKSGERRKLLSRVADSPYTMIFLETPHRLLASLKDLVHILDNRQISIARELTKLHEEFFRGEINAAIEHFSATPPRGEFTLVVAGYKARSQRWSEEQLLKILQERLTHDEPPSKIAGEIAVLSSWPRRDVYRRLTEIQTKG